MNSAYLAGLIDGEGYLGLIPGKNAQNKNRNFEPTIKIGMTGSTAKYIATELVKQYGGHIETKNELTTGNRQAYTYIAKSKPRVKTILTDIYPYLIVKKDQADVLLKFCSLGSSHTRYGNFSNEIIELKETLYTKLRSLKMAESLATTE